MHAAGLPWGVVAPDTEALALSDPILAADLGRHKCLACIYRRSAQTIHPRRPEGDHGWTNWPPWPVDCTSYRPVTATAGSGAGPQAGPIVSHLTRHGEAYVRGHKEKYAAEVRARQEKQVRRGRRSWGSRWCESSPPPAESPTGTAQARAG